LVYEGGGGGVVDGGADKSVRRLLGVGTVEIGGAGEGAVYVGLDLVGVDSVEDFWVAF